MKRKLVCLIDDEFESKVEVEGGSVMAEEWLQRLNRSEKRCWREGDVRRVHVRLSNGEELAEEWSVVTGCLQKRAWRQTALNNLGAEADWLVEVGEPPPVPPTAQLEIRESNDQPIVSRRNTKKNLEWRIRNLPYPLEVYSVAADESNCQLTVRTTNKKYYKKLDLSEIKRIGLRPIQANISFMHKFNTLIISYKKPEELIKFEKLWFEELAKIEKKESPLDDCKIS